MRIKIWRIRTPEKGCPHFPINQFMLFFNFLKNLSLNFINFFHFAHFLKRLFGILSVNKLKNYFNINYAIFEVSWFPGTMKFLISL